MQDLSYHHQNNRGDKRIGSRDFEQTEQKRRRNREGLGLPDAETEGLTIDE